MQVDRRPEFRTLQEPKVYIPRPVDAIIERVISARSTTMLHNDSQWPFDLAALRISDANARNFGIPDSQSIAEIPWIHRAQFTTTLLLQGPRGIGATSAMRHSFETHCNTHREAPAKGTLRPLPVWIDIATDGDWETSVTQQFREQLPPEHQGLYDDYYKGEAIYCERGQARFKDPLRSFLVGLSRTGYLPVIFIDRGKGNQAHIAHQFDRYEDLHGRILAPMSDFGYGVAIAAHIPESWVNGLSNSQNLWTEARDGTAFSPVEVAPLTLRETHSLLQSTPGLREPTDINHAHIVHRFSGGIPSLVEPVTRKLQRLLAVYDAEQAIIHLGREVLRDLVPPMYAQVKEEFHGPFEQIMLMRVVDETVLYKGGNLGSINPYTLSHDYARVNLTHAVYQDRTGSIPNGTQFTHAPLREVVDLCLATSDPKRYQSMHAQAAEAFNQAIPTANEFDDPQLRRQLGDIYITEYQYHSSRAQSVA